MYREMDKEETCTEMVEERYTEGTVPLPLAVPDVPPR